MGKRGPLLLAVLAVCAQFAQRPEPAQGHLGLDALDDGTKAEVTRNPNSAEAHLQRARVLQLKHEWDAALAELELAAARGGDPDVIDAALASVYLDAGQPGMAMVQLDRLVQRRPTAFGAIFQRAQAWLALGDFERAATDFGTAIAGLPSPNPEQVIAHRDALLRLGRKEAALRALDQGMDRVGRVVSLQMPAVDLEVELGRYASALRRLDDVIRLGPPNPKWIARRGEILELAGQQGEARTEYMRALALIDRRDRGRRKGFDDLRQRLETALAATNADYKGDTR